MREIVLDTETTGLDPASGHRVVEVACIELENHTPTGAEFQRYVNPDRDMPDQAYQIHGLSEDFLRGHPVFADIADDLLAFIDEDPLVIHNAEFDIGFLNAELARIDRPQIPISRAVDTMHMARRKYPGAQASLDALCKRFEIDLSAREKHGALVDVELLARVYLELRGGSQQSLSLAGTETALADAAPGMPAPTQPAREPRPHAPTAAELAAHETFLSRLTNPLWRK